MESIFHFVSYIAGINYYPVYWRSNFFTRDWLKILIIIFYALVLVIWIFTVFTKICFFRIKFISILWIYQLFMFVEPDYDEFFGVYKWINAEGTRLIFSTEGMLPNMTKGDSVDHLVVWDIQNSLYNFSLFIHTIV
jgi:energy-coupling factor transporter transmembrane protein EcfT